MPALTSSLLSSTFVSMFYLAMAWAFASQPSLLGVVVAASELLANLTGLAWATTRIPLSIGRQVQLGWASRAIGTILLIDGRYLPLQLVGVVAVAITPNVIASLEKASLVADDSEVEAMVGKFTRLRQLQLAANFLSPLVAGLLLSHRDRLLLTAAIVIFPVAGTVVGHFFPSLPPSSAVTVERKGGNEGSSGYRRWKWRWSYQPMVGGIIAMMFLGNLVIWGPELTIFPAFFQLAGMSAAGLGLATTCGRIGEFIGLYVLQRLRVPIRWMATSVALAFVLHAAGFLILGITAPTQVYWWCVIIALTNFSLAAFTPYLSTLVSFFYPDPHERARAIGSVGSLANLGEPIGALGASVAASVAPSVALMIVGTLGVIIGGAFVGLFLQQSRGMASDSRNFSTSR